MSVITDVAIVCTSSDDAAIAQVNTYLDLADDARHQQFVKMDNSTAGGSKFPSMTVYQACFNHLFDGHILQAFKEADWRLKDNILIIDSELTGYWVYTTEKTIYSNEMILW